MDLSDRPLACLKNRLPSLSLPGQLFAGRDIRERALPHFVYEIAPLDVEQGEAQIGLQVILGSAKSSLRGCHEYCLRARALISVRDSRFSELKN